MTGELPPAARVLRNITNEEALAAASPRTVFKELRQAYDHRLLRTRGHRASGTAAGGGVVPEAASKRVPPVADAAVFAELLRSASMAPSSTLPAVSEAAAHSIATASPSAHLLTPAATMPSVVAAEATAQDIADLLEVIVRDPSPPSALRSHSDVVHPSQGQQEEELQNLRAQLRSAAAANPVKTQHNMESIQQIQADELKSLKEDRESLIGQLEQMTLAAEECEEKFISVTEQGQQEQQRQREQLKAAMAEIYVHDNSQRSGEIMALKAERDDLLTQLEQMTLVAEEREISRITMSVELAAATTRAGHTCISSCTAQHPEFDDVLQSPEKFNETTGNAADRAEDVTAAAVALVEREEALRAGESKLVAAQAELVKSMEAKRLINQTYAALKLRESKLEACVDELHRVIPLPPPPPNAHTQAHLPLH